MFAAAIALSTPTEVRCKMPKLSHGYAAHLCVPNVWPAPDLQVDFYDLVSISLQ